MFLLQKQTKEKHYGYHQGTRGLMLGSRTCNPKGHGFKSQVWQEL